MKNDIDFDELDKAVNSLMGGVPGSDDDAVQQKTLTISTTLQPNEDPEYNKIKEVAKGIGDETFVIDSDPDIVKDLGEIASPNAPTTPNESLRAAQSITIPSSPAKTPITSSTPVEASAPAPATPKPSSGRFMDVVHPSSDMRSATKDKDVAPAVTAPAEVKTPDTPAATPAPEPKKPVVARPKPTSAPELHGPVTTPFLPDAKVEKRPLGDPSAPPVTVTPTVPDQAQADPVGSDEPEEIVAINSETKLHADRTEDSQSVLDATAIVTEANDETAEELSAIESAEVDPSGSTVQEVESVAAERAASMAPAGANMYDVQPLGHPAKRRSGWGVVLVIVIIIVVAAALGAGAFFIFGPGA